MLRVRDDADRVAFGLLAGRWRPRLRAFFAATLADRQAADDHAQETLLRLWLLRERYQPTGRFEAYLLTIARHHGQNAQVKFRARAARETSGDGEDLVLVAPDRVSEPERVILQQHEHARVRAAINALPPLYRNVFTLSHDEGLRYAEIAARLAIPVGTVKSRMAEAVRRLRAVLNDDAA
jgi:RNA polymerase sigma-70 factor (ECF subfamily)